MTLFEGYKIYGPVYHKRIDRYMMFFVSPDHRTSMTYARWLMCQKENRLLEPWEHVDHIDGNRTNDVIENLQILSQPENNRKSASGITTIELTCPNCSATFVRERRQIVHKSRKHPPCCSRSCAAKYQFHGGIPQPG